MQTAHLQLQSSRRRTARLLASIAVERARCINRPHFGATVLQSLHNRVKTTAGNPVNQRPCQQRERMIVFATLLLLLLSALPLTAPVNSTPRRFDRPSIPIRQVPDLFFFSSSNYEPRATPSVYDYLMPLLGHVFNRPREKYSSKRFGAIKIYWSSCGAR